MIEKGQFFTNIPKWILYTVLLAVCEVLIELPHIGLNLQRPAFAQIKPDKSLGSERSIVNSGFELDGRPVQRIQGGARRGSNLFHSFQDFNVGKGNGVFFANPTGIENILSRVTGKSQSNILGELGVLGSANLWLLNPNGILFGPNASLQLNGSFFASTADAIPLGEQGLFSAVEPKQSQLLSVSPGASFFEQVANQSGSITNRGNITVGEQQSVGLVGDRFLHTGAITAPGGSVTLLGNQVSLEGMATVDVSSISSGGAILIGGDVLGGTVANADRTFIGPDVVINANALTQGSGGRVIVGADEVVGFYGQVNARGGSVSGDGGFVEVSGKEHVLFRGYVDTSAVQGEIGELVLDPVNITIANGSGDVADDGTDTFSGDESGLAGSVLSQPLSAFDDAAPVTIYETELEGLSGDTNVSLQATNDIRVEDLTDDELVFAAGDGSIEFLADADADGAGAFVMLDSMEDTIATNGRDLKISGASLELGNIITSRGTNDGGDVVLEAIGDINSASIISNSGFLSLTVPRDSGKSGDISISTIAGNIIIDGPVESVSESNTGNSGRGGDITFSSTTGDIRTNELVNSASFSPVGNSGRGGDITFSSTSGNISANELVDSASFSLAGNTGRGGDITFSSTSGNISTNELVNSTSVTFEGNSGRGGDITFSSNSGKISTDETVISFSESSTGNSGRGGNISFSSTSREITTNKQIDSASRAFAGNSGRGGDISFSSTSGEITTNEQVGSASFASEGNSGRGGNITFFSTRGNITTNEEVESFSFSSNGQSGRGGDISISSTSGGNIWVKDNLRGGTSSPDGNAGRSGDIELLTNGGFIRGDNTQLSVFSIAENGGVSGDGGSVMLTSDDISGLEIVTVSSSGNSGDVKIQSFTGNLRVRNTRLNTSGQVEIPSPIDPEAPISLNVNDFGPSGRTDIIGTGEILLDNFQIQSNSNGSNDAGGVSITSPGRIRIRNSQINSNTNNSGNAGDITIKTQEGISITGEAGEDHGIFASSEASGDAGSINIDAGNSFILGNNTQLVVETSGTGQAGNITVNTNQLTIGTDAQLSATANQTATNPEGGGNIDINAANLDISGELGVFAETQGQTPAGTLTLKPNGNNLDLNIVFTNNGFISASTTASGLGGDINLSAPQAININGAGQIAVASTGRGDAGNIDIRSQTLVLSEEVEITASTSSPLASGGNIEVNAQAIRLNDADITTNVNAGLGGGGDIELTADNLTLSQGTISAETVDSFGGNIYLDISNLLLLRDYSQISTRAFGDQASGNGGNITINTPILFAVPNNNSDITAEAFQGEGGEISIRTQGLFGIAVQEQAPVSNDITASSEVGLDGLVQVETSDVDRTDNLVKLPEVLQNIILTKGCQQGSQSKFVVSRRGGYPLAPAEIGTLSPSSWEDLRPFESNSHELEEPIASNNAPSEISIVEAQGWNKNSNGQIALVADTSKVTASAVEQAPAICRS